MQVLASNTQARTCEIATEISRISIFLVLAEPDWNRSAPRIHVRTIGSSEVSGKIEPFP
jgi:hypothetical protein